MELERYCRKFDAHNGHDINSAIFAATTKVDDPKWNAESDPVDIRLDSAFLKRTRSRTEIPGLRTLHPDDSSKIAADSVMTRVKEGGGGGFGGGEWRCKYMESSALRSRPCRSD
jgi:hypothetical protein